MILCLSEIYLDSTTPDSFLELEGHNLVHAEHFDNIKRGGVCINYKGWLSAWIINLTHFKELWNELHQ